MGSRFKFEMDFKPVWCRDYGENQDSTGKMGGIKFNKTILFF